MKKLLLIAITLILTNTVKSQQVNQDKFASFDCQYVGGRVNLCWSATYDPDDGVFFVERSDNGIEFKKIAYKPSSVLPFNSQTIIYSFIDTDPLPGYSYYRILSHGNSIYSEVKMVYNNYPSLTEKTEKKEPELLN